MNFLQHILEIDRRLEERKQNELQMTFFGMDSGSGIEGALGATHTVTHTQRLPGGGRRTITNGRMTSESHPVPGIPGMRVRTTF